MTSPTPANLTVGILFPGELGTAFGHLLTERGTRVVTTSDGRGARTTDRAASCGMTVLPSLGDVIEQSDLVVSAVTPSAASAVAEQVASERFRHLGQLLYLDVNAVSPATMAALGRVLSAVDIDLVDGGVHGQAARLADRATLYLSGPSATIVARLLGERPRSVVLGDTIGQASLLKLLLSGVNKGLVALMLEFSEAAETEGLLDEFWSACRDSYPGVMSTFERLLPSYPTHAGRRAEELGELETAISAAGGQPLMASATRRSIEERSRVAEGWDRLIERLGSDVDG